MTWTTESLCEHTVDLYEPAGLKPRFGILFLHDVDGQTCKDQPTFTRLFTELGLICACPHAGATWWVNRPGSGFAAALTPESYVLKEVLPLFEQRWQLAPPAIGLLGLGMGGQGVLRLAFKQPALFPVVAALAPALDYHELYGEGTILDELYDSKEQCRQDTATMWLPPFHPPPHIFYCTDPEDEWLRGADRLHEKMNALGVPHTCDLTTRAGGHTWAYADRMVESALRFLVAGLERESRRLL